VEEVLPEKIKVELVPDLSHCIETVVKREYQETVQSLLSLETACEELKERVEILRLFLESTDFRKLRAESDAHLLWGERVRFVVYLEGSTVKHDMLSEPC
jgi:hypothetical protein